jgi:hypothetical protein
MREVEDHLERIRGAWMAGRSALEHCPPDWRAAIDAAPAAEPALAALTGHALQVLFNPAQPPALTPRALLPRLPLPTPPETARATLRRLLGARKGDDGARLPVLFLLRRGYGMHPADWLPRPRDDWAPAVYAPWLAWASSQAVQPATLTAEAYDAMTAPMQRAALAQLRGQDPAAARAIIAAKAPGEAAEQRARLVELLEDRLGPDDLPLLESLAADRSERVRTAAGRLLSRLGRGSAELTLARELAAMVEVSRVGLIKRRTQVKLPQLKTGVQEQRRYALFSMVAAADLAQVLGVEEAALVETVPVGGQLAAYGFKTMIAETGSDTARRTLLEGLLAQADTPVPQMTLLARRAGIPERASAMAAILARDAAPNFDDSLAFAGDALGEASARGLPQSPGYRALLEQIGAAASQDGGRGVIAAAGLFNLGLLLDAVGAAEVIRACVAAELSTADPRLDMLHLNIALNPEPKT